MESKQGNFLIPLTEWTDADSLKGCLVRVRLSGLRYLFVILSGIMLSLYAPVVLAKEPVKLFEPPRLFMIPTAYTLKAYDINASGGATLESNQISFLGTGLIGLGNVAQFEFGALRQFRSKNDSMNGTMDDSIGDSMDDSMNNAMIPSTKSSLMDRMDDSEDNSRNDEFIDLGNTPVVGIKIALPLEQVSFLLPNLAVSYRRTFGREEEGEGGAYKRQLADLYAVASKSFFSKGERWRGFSLHAGVDYFGARLTMSEHSNSQSVKFLKPFGGLEIWASRHAKLMAEFEWVPEINEEMLMIEEEPIWMSIVGVRIFFTRFLTADIGVRYQQNFDTIADAKVEANIGLSIPTHLVSKLK